jgi:hypothetical protein
MCDHLLGALVCDRPDIHDPAAAGGHTYTSAYGSHVADAHTEHVDD